MSDKKVLLVYPPITSQERYGSNLGLFGGSQIPLGIYYLAAFLRESGYEVDAIDGEAENLTAEDVLDRMHEGEFNVLGVSTITVAFHRAVELAQMAKERSPDSIVIVGGPHVSSQPEQPLTFDCFDFAMRNEGELTFVAFLEMLESNGDPSAVEGLIFRDNGKIVVNEARDYISDLDSLPFPAFDLIPDIDAYSPPPFNYRKRPVANIITSRGCPNDCTFCERTTFGKKARLRSAKNIVDEIEMLIRDYGAKEISFVDDTFTLRPKRIYEIFDLVRERGLSFPWTCMSRINTVDADLLTYMRNNGCWYIAFGIESGDENILARIRKRIKLVDVKRVVDTCYRLGIKTKGFFIVGHPEETEETIDKTIDFARSLELDHIVATINTPMPGSHQYRHAHEFGQLDETSWQQFNYWSPVFVPHGLT